MSVAVGWGRHLQRIAERPTAYDWIQWAAGRSIVDRHLHPWLRFPAGSLVVDVGGGTGGLKAQLQQGVRHVCLDLERPKLDGYVSKFADAHPLQGDATALPIRDGVVDVIALSNVTHHLTDTQIECVVKEAARVLRPDGVLFVCDAVWAPTRRVGRWLWRHDRGSHPRTAEQIEAVLRRKFNIVQTGQFVVLHAYAAFLCRPTGCITSEPWRNVVA